MPKRIDGSKKRQAENFHFWLPVKIANDFRKEAKSLDRPLAWLFREILKGRYEIE